MSPSLLPYALSNLVRNRRRTLTSILGVFLAITFISGTIIAVDSSSRSLLDAYLAGVPGDFSLSMMDPWGSLNWSSLEASVDAVPGVAETALYRPVPAYQVSNAASPNRGPSWGQAWAIDPQHPPHFLEGIDVNGTLALSNGTAAVTQDLANADGLTEGSVVRLSAPRYTDGNWTGNYTCNLTVVGVLAAPANTTYARSVFVGLGYAKWVEAQLNQTSAAYSWSGEIWLDRSRFILPYDAAATQRNLLRLERSLGDAAGAYGAFVQDNDIARVGTYSASLGSERLLFLLLSIPVALLGLYLGAVGVELGHADRRRELAVLRSRGARPRQVLALLMFEALLGGLAATVLGLLAGVLVSRALLAVVNPVGAAYVPDYLDLLVSWQTPFLVAGLSVAFMAAVSYGSARRTAHLSIVETLRYYAPGETRIYYTPAADIVLTVYSVLAYAFVALYTPSTADLWSFLLTLFFYASLPLTPLLLVFGATRLATRSTGKVYELTAKACRPFSPDLEYLISRDVSRNPRRASNVAVIIALGLAFGIFALSLFGSLEAYQDRIIRTYTGSDAKVVPPDPTAGGFGASLAALPGISAVTAVEYGPGESTWGYAPLVGIDPGSYFAVVRPEAFYLMGMGAAQAESALASNGTVLVTQAYADALALQVGDRLPFTADYVNRTGVRRTAYTNATVGGIVEVLPGTNPATWYPLSGTYGPGGSGSAILTANVAPPLIYGSPETFSALWQPPDAAISSSATGYLASLAFGADWRTVKQEIEGLGASPPIMYQELVDTMARSPVQTSVDGYVEMETGFIVLILTTGLGLIVYVSSREREVEFAGIIARGASRRQAAGLVLGEAFSIMLIGLVAGTVVGVASGLLYDPFLFVSFNTGLFSSAIPFLFEFPLTAFLLLAGTVGAMLLAALVASWGISRMDVARVLKLRGG